MNSPFFFGRWLVCLAGAIACPSWGSLPAAIACQSTGLGPTLRSIQSVIPEGQEDLQPAPELPAGETRLWEIGLEITAHENCSNLRALFPVPLDWPEQTVAIVGEDSTANVTRTELGRDENGARRMSLWIAGLAAGEQAHVLLRLEITRRPQNVPGDTASLVFAKKPPREVKAWLVPSPQIESRSRVIRDLADSLPIDASLPAWSQVELIYDWVRDNIRYEFAAQNRSCLECLESRKGDCGEMTGLFVALCRARGIPARSVWIPDHAYPEFYLEDAAGNGHWFPCQVAGSRDFGGLAESRPALQKGDRYRLPGQRDESRFLQPTLACDGSAGMKFILRPVDDPPSPRER